MIDTLPVKGNSSPVGGPLPICEEFRREKMAYTFQVYKDKAGEFRFRFKAPNGEIMFGSEGYKAKGSATDAIESIQKHAPAATVEDQTK
jgi:uncharacterized protein YegP (UPF0339 family)